MSGDPEDRDHTEFIAFDGHELEGEQVVLSRAAFMLHGMAVMNSIRDGDPGFVPDEYLNAIKAETTVTAAELVTAGLWRRDDGGYLVLDQHILKMAIDADDHLAQLKAQCAATSGHEPDADHPSICAKCGAMLD